VFLGVELAYGWGRCPHSRFACQAVLLLSRKVDAQALAGSFAATPLAPPDADTAGLLRRYSRSHYPAAAAIAVSTRLPPSALAALGLADLSEGADMVQAGGRSIAIPEPLRGIVRAHLAFRLSGGAKRRDPLFVVEKRRAGGRQGRVFDRTTAHGLHQGLRRVALETGLTVVPPEDRAHVEPRRWLRRQGITVHRLDPRPRSA
jgi:hypothetical protein